MSIAVRRITPEDWREVKALRLQALADPAAPMAFLDTVEHAAAQPDRFWQERAANASGDAAAAQFVAIADDGTWTGTITLLPHREQHDAGLVVGSTWRMRTAVRASSMRSSTPRPPGHAIAGCVRSCSRCT